MDWIDPRYTHDDASAKPQSTKKLRSRKKGSKTLTRQISAALAQPVDVWSAAYEHALAGLKWPQGCSLEGTLLWSTLIQEQAEVLVRAGVSAQRLASIVADESTASEQEQLAAVVGLMDQSLETIAFQWLDEADVYPHAALGVIATAWNIPEHARRPPSEWLTQWLEAVSDRTTNFDQDGSDCVLGNLVFRCELPLLIGLATAASKRTMLSEASRAMDNLAEHLESSVDLPAPWLAHGATYLRAALGSVLRSRVIANSLGLRKWYPPQQNALAELLKHAARWVRPDGTQLLSAGSPTKRCKAIWETLVKQSSNSKSLKDAMVFSGLLTGNRAELKSKVKPSRLPALTNYDDDACCVVMQYDWRHRGARVALDFSDTDLCLEALGPKGTPLLAGEWTAQVELDGQAQMQLDGWGELCWFSDADVDYLELEAKFGQHAKVQRQLILFRKERLLLAADALLCDKDGAWTLQSQLPLGANIEFEGQKKNTEGFLSSASGKCLVVPLFLPEWKQQVATGSVVSSNGNLVVRNACENARRLYSPMVISLCNRYTKKPLTWRQLTVGEDLRVVGRDEAVAYRLQLGKEQIVMYRTLAPAIRRTALGMHTLSDFYAGRFDAELGEIDTLVEVEPT